jgi:hypothetical protein
MAEQMSKDGRSAAQIRRHFKAEEDRQAAAELRATAYVGWLVTNELFLADRDQQRDRWDEPIAATGLFPAHPLSVLGVRRGAVGREEAGLLAFYRRWGLETSLTWDLPVPMRPQFFNVPYADAPSLTGAGLVLFLPWHLLRDGQLSLQELAQHLRTERHPAHLEGWLSRGPGGQGLGYQRLRQVLVLYCSWGLALAGRYQDRPRGNTERLDRAFARYLRLGEDSVKKLRLTVWGRSADESENVEDAD